MKWLPRRRRVDLEKHESPEVQKTRTELREVLSRWDPINTLVTTLSTMNGENHYSDVILEAMKKGRVE